MAVLSVLTPYVYAKSGKAELPKIFICKEGGDHLRVIYLY